MWMAADQPEKPLTEKVLRISKLPFCTKSLWQSQIMGKRKRKRVQKDN